MKACLLSALLLASAPAFAQQPYKGPEVSTPAKRSEVIVLHSPDSASVAYAKVKQSLLAAGYGIDKHDKDALFFSTPAKPLDDKISLILQVSSRSSATGSDVTIRGFFTWLSATTIMAHVENRQIPVQYIGAGRNPMQRAWQAMQEAAALALPGAKIGYK